MWKNNSSYVKIVLEKYMNYCPGNSAENRRPGKKVRSGFCGLFCVLSAGRPCSFVQKIRPFRQTNSRMREVCGGALPAD